MIWSRLAGPFREFGMFTGSLYAVERVLSALSPQLGLHAYDLVAQPVPETGTLPARHAQHIRFVELRPGDAPLQAMPPSDEVKSARFAQGAVALAVYRKDRYIGYIWLCFRRYEEDEVRCTYELARPEQASFDFDLYVFPEYRLGLAFAAIWHAANRYLHQRGVRQTFSRISLFNLSSRRAHAHLGARSVSRAVFLRAWKVQLMVATQAPYVALGWRNQARPRLRLDSAGD